VSRKGAKGLWGEGRVRSLACPGLYGEGWQAHSVRRESCDSPSSPEPAAGLFGGLVGRGASSEPRVPGLVRRGLAGALRARERAAILPAVQSLRLASSEGENGEGVSREGGKGLGGEGRLGKTPEGQGDRALRGLSTRGATQEDRHLVVSTEKRGELERLVVEANSREHPRRLPVTFYPSSSEEGTRVGSITSKPDGVVDESMVSLSATASVHACEAGGMWRHETIRRK
jgi:hypothetical protein